MSTMEHQSYPPIEVDIRIRPREEESRIEPPASYWPQIFAAISATLGGLVMGTCIGWSGPALHLLVTNTSEPFNDPNHEFAVSEEQGSLIASLLPCGALFGGLTGGFLINRLGRKGTMMGDSVLFALAYLCLAAAQNVWMLFLGRILCGFACGITTIAAPTYVSEVSSPKIRGTLGSCFQLMVTIGVLYTGIVGAFVTWRWLSVACLALSLLWSLAVLVNPESPAYLMSHKNYDGARASLQKLRGHAYIETELSQTQASLEEAASQRFQISVLWESVNLRPLVVALMLMVGQQLSGVNAVIFFSVNIFNSAKTNLNSLLENIIVGGVQVVATALAAILIDKLGRRILLISSALIMIISLYGLGLYFWIQKSHPDVANSISFLPLSSLCLYIFAFSIGFGPIPWLMMSEIFSPEVKGITSSISSAFNWSLAFFVTEFFQPVVKEVGSAGTFWSFAIILLLVMTFTVFFIPETKGKSLQEIQAQFRGMAAANDDVAPILDDQLESTIEAEVNAEIRTISA